MKNKTYINKRLVNEMGLKVIDGEWVDKYGRILEEYIDEKGYRDLKPTGRCSRKV